MPAEAPDAVDRRGVNPQSSWIDRGQNVLMNTYASFPLVIKSGKGSYVQDVSGKQYLDFVSGIAVNSLGHCNPEIIAAVTSQMATLSHCSNLYLNMPAIELAESLVQGSVFSRAFFCNSGTEAIEAALKLSRKFAKSVKGNACTKIFTLKNSFHGRTYGALSATGQSKYHEGYHPLVPDCDTFTPEELDGLHPDVIAGIMVEPIQGEGGIHVLDSTFLKKLRAFCTTNKIVLVFDEVQCGVGRTGSFFAYEKMAVEPDVVALAKGLGGGFPIGAMLAKEEFAQTFKPGDHGSTFGGNPAACSAALTVVQIVKQPEFLAGITDKSQILFQVLNGLTQTKLAIIQVRGLGLMVGVEFDAPVKPIINACIEKGLLVVAAGECVIRLLPPLTVTAEEIGQAVSILAQVLSEHSP